MKIIALISRILLGLVFVVFGANIFLQFIPPPKDMVMPDLAIKFYTALAGSHYIQVVGALQILGGLLLLSGFFVPAGLSILGPVIVNILLFHTLLEQGGLVPVPLVVAALWLVVFAGYWNSFATVLKPKP